MIDSTSPQWGPEPPTRLPPSRVRATSSVWSVAAARLARSVFRRPFFKPPVVTVRCMIACKVKLWSAPDQAAASSGVPRGFGTRAFAPVSEGRSATATLRPFVADPLPCIQIVPARIVPRRHHDRSPHLPPSPGSMASWSFPALRGSATNHWLSAIRRRCPGIDSPALCPIRRWRFSSQPEKWPCWFFSPLPVARTCGVGGGVRDRCHVAKPPSAPIRLLNGAYHPDQCPDHAPPAGRPRPSPSRTTSSSRCVRGRR